MGSWFQTIILIYSSNGKNYNSLDLKIKLNSIMFDKDQVKSVV